MAPMTKHRPVPTGGALNVDELGSSFNAHYKQRSARRQYLTAQLHAAGPRPILEALLEVDAGCDLDCVLERYARIPAAIYRALGADALTIDSVRVVDGGRA